jgi:hypothetical protein
VITPPVTATTGSVGQQADQDGGRQADGQQRVQVRGAGREAPADSAEDHEERRRRDGDQRRRLPQHSVDQGGRCQREHHRARQPHDAPQQRRKPRFGAPRISHVARIDARIRASIDARVDIR